MASANPIAATIQTIGTHRRILGLINYLAPRIYYPTGCGRNVFEASPISGRKPHRRLFARRKVM